MKDDAPHPNDSRPAHIIRAGRLPLALATVVALVAAAPVAAQVIANSSFEGNLAGWTVGGAGRVDVIQASHLQGGSIPGGVPDGQWFAVLSTTTSVSGSCGGFLQPPCSGAWARAQIDANTTWEYDISTLSINVSIPFWPAVLAFDWTFPSSEQDQPGQYDDLFDVMIYQGTPPSDPTTDNRVFARSAPRNVPEDFSNFTNAHFLGTTVVNWSINRSGSPVNGTALAYGAAGFRRACVSIDLPEFPGPPYNRTIRFRVADQADRQFDSALFLDNVQVLQSCDPLLQMDITQRTHTSGADLEVKDGGFVHRQVLAKRIALDPSGRVMAVVSNANLDGTNPNLIEQVFIQVDEGGWQRVTGLPMQAGGEVQSMAFSGTVGATPGRYLAIAAQLSETDNVEVYRWDRQGAGALTTVTNTSGCENINVSINGNGGVIAFESTCNAVTGAGTDRKINLWTGGGANSGNAFLPGGSCIGRNPALNSRSDQDGTYLAFESNCNPTGGNNDGNFEIFRYRNSGSAGTRFAQITSTTGAVVNMLPQMDRASNGANIYFLSNRHNASAGPQVHHFACSNNNCTGGTLSQWTDGPPTQLYLGLRKLVNPASNDVDQDLIFERFSTTSLTTEIGHRIGPTGQETSISFQQGFGVLGLSAGRDGNVPVLGFLTRQDIVNGQNPDGNPEAFLGRVEP